MMNTQMFFLIAGLALALGLVGAVAENVIMTQNAFAAGGPKGEKNYGQCKQDFPDKPCRNFHTGS
jgi:hypothetical protein